MLASVLRAVLETQEETYRRIWDETRKLVHYLRQVDVPIPDALALAARHVLEQQVCAELQQLDAHAVIPARVPEIVEEARALGLSLDLRPARFTANRAVCRALEAVRAEPSPARVAEAQALIEGARRLGVRYGHWATQNRFFELWRGSGPEARRALGPLADALGFSLAP